MTLDGEKLVVKEGQNDGTVEFVGQMITDISLMISVFLPLTYMLI